VLQVLGITVNGTALSGMKITFSADLSSIIDKERRNNASSSQISFFDMLDSAI
jgi:hypothetical protein